MVKTLSMMREEIHLNTRNRFVNSQVDTKINNAYMEICCWEEYPFLRKWQDMPITTAGQYVFSLPSDWLKTEKIYDKTDNSIQYYQEFHYYEKENYEVRFKSDSIPAGNMVIQYFRKPDLLVNSSDIPIIPDCAHELIVLIAEQRLLGINATDKAQYEEIKAMREAREKEWRADHKSSPARAKKIIPCSSNGDVQPFFSPLGDGF